MAISFERVLRTLVMATDKDAGEEREVR